MLPVNHASYHANQKTVLATATVVSALHILAGVALMYMPSLKHLQPKITPPIQISFIQPSEPAISEPETAVNPPAEPKKIEKPDTTPPIQKPEEPTIQQPIKQPAKQTKSNKETPKVFANNSIESQIDEKLILAQQIQEAERISQQKAQQAAEQQRLAEQQRAREIAQQNAERERAEKERADRERADRERAEKAKADKERADREKAEKAERERIAQNSQPVNFGASDVKWKSKPNTNLPANLKKIVNEKNISMIGVRLNVSATGSVTAVTITQSSGDSQIDNFIRQRMQNAKFFPFKRNGVAVAGVGNLTIAIN